MLCGVSCFQWFKDTNLKANHNCPATHTAPVAAVSNGSKILIWKQITTNRCTIEGTQCCFQWFKDTNLKANHNYTTPILSRYWAVSNGSKILIWKQITTVCVQGKLLVCCFQWFKDTNLKANHNIIAFVMCVGAAVSNGSKILIWKQITTSVSKRTRSISLFPMVQRY